MTERAINLKAKKFLELDAEIKELKKQQDKIKKDIQTEMGESEELATEKFLIRWTSFTKSIFDTKMFKAERPDLFNIFSKQSNERRFSVAVKEA